MSLKSANIIKGINMTIVLSVTALNTSPPFRFRNTFFNIAKDSYRTGHLQRRRRSAGRLVRASRYLQQVVTELGLDRPFYAIHIGAEYDLVEFRHHHAGTEFAQVATLLT